MQRMCQWLQIDGEQERWELSWFFDFVCGEFDIFGVGILDTNEEGHGVDHTQE